MAESGQGNSTDQSDKPIKNEMDITTSIQDLQSHEQRQVRDTVAQVRKCGLESILDLPQLVVCGDQSAGKSSVLEALTEIPFPRNENLCTRFATEIILRRATTDSLAIKIIPNTKRPDVERATLKAFNKSITNFDELPLLMGDAMAAMGVDDVLATDSRAGAFARDVLSIVIEGPSRPQLTLVDIPGLIQTETKGVTKADVGIVAEITDQYISQQRTICLAVVSGANDHANQKILTKVREFDPQGNRTLGIITKPDRLPSGSQSEAKFIDLANNQDIFFKLGWHVLKNRKYEEKDFTLDERNAAEATYFARSNFKTLPANCLGIDTLRTRLSHLLFEHVKNELPKLRNDLEAALADTQSQLKNLGQPRTKATECKVYLSQLSLDYHEVCKAAVDGHYEGSYFDTKDEHASSLQSPAIIRRIRAVLQYMNAEFAKSIRLYGHKYRIDMFDKARNDNTDTYSIDNEPTQIITKPVEMDKDSAFAWVRLVLTRTRGRELIGNFNPLLVGELFWEQSSKWEKMALHHLDEVAQVCSRFLHNLLEDMCPHDVSTRLQASLVEDALKTRHDNAVQEVRRIMEENRSYPINYNHYYTDTINKRRQQRQKESLAESIANATEHTHLEGCHSNHTSASINIDKVVQMPSQQIDPNMENLSCEEALDCLYAIYKVIRV